MEKLFNFIKDTDFIGKVVYVDTTKLTRIIHQVLNLKN